MNRIALLHTLPFVVRLFDTLMQERFPRANCFHMLDQSLIQDLLRNGMGPGIVHRISGHVALATEAGADFVLFTCSSTSPAVDTVRMMFDVPIMKIDDPMAEKAVATGRRIGLLCTARSTAGPSESLLRAHATEAGKEIDVAVRVEDDAFSAINAGDKDRHDSLIEAAAAKMAESCDVVVLAQATMAHMAPVLNERLSVPVLASPELCLQALEKVVDA
jgi:Asp/Glu/hydantoin racemase